MKIEAGKDYLLKSVRGALEALHQTDGMKMFFQSVGIIT
jgi:hypothetical protein